MRRFVPFAVLLSTIAFAQTTVASAQGPQIPDVMAARAYAMGGAYRSLGLGTEALDGNPASIGIYKRYLIELSGAWDPRNPFGFGSVSVMDSVTSPLSAGITYHLVSLGSGETQRTAHINTGAFSIPFGPTLSIGLSMRHVLMTGAQNANAVTGDAGVVLNFGGLVFGFSGHNLIDIRNPEFQRFYALSVGWTSPVFSLAADVRGDFNGPTPVFAVSAGGEYVLGNFLPIRAGYAWDQFRRARLVTGGLGLMIDNAEIDFGYQHELGGSSSRLLALTLRIQVQ
ncbi:MAG: hypothetical protein IRZ16_11500 [Myxococcaceae bacterium]|nr:hypothetical protein [Myxococcaceae bacterium]